MSSRASTPTALARQLLGAGRQTEALPLLEEAARSQPEDVQAWAVLGAVQGQLGQPVEAEVALRRALALRPDLAELYFNLGNALRDQIRLGEAAASYRRGIELARAAGGAIAPRWADAWNNLGNLLKDLGRGEEAVACFREALALRPRDAGIHSNLLLCLNYLGSVSRAEIYAEHRRWARQHAAGLRRTTDFVNDPDPERRLRLGYISPDFRRHAAAHFIEPLFAHHDHVAFEVYGYANVAQPDAITEYLRGLTDHWRDVHRLSDEQLAGQVRADGIDVLVELAGHTGGGRLLVLARRPAPVQGMFLGYPNTSGLDTVDFRITDPVCNPPDSEPYFTERLVRLSSRYCYLPPLGLPDAGSSPVSEQGYPTFGSFNSLAKVTAEVVALWAKLLRALPEARLVLKAGSLTDAATCADVAGRFAAHGIERQRLDLEGFSPFGEYLESMYRCDIALDPFPYNGGTTSCHALWMGLPLVTLTGETYMSRIGTSLLRTLGLPELAARTPQEYVRIACDLATDRVRLSQLRAGLRARMAISSLTDGCGYTAAVEGAYRGLWREWCRRSQGSSMA